MLKSTWPEGDKGPLVEGLGHYRFMGALVEPSTGMNLVFAHLRRSSISNGRRLQWWLYRTRGAGKKRKKEYRKGQGHTREKTTK